jgi:uncharacterized protein YjbI with pentapeptide repeats
MCNFSGQDLTKANFQGATLTAVVFLKANLTGADFSNATIVDSQNPVFPTDFSFSTLTNAKFIGTTFNGTTYFTYATLTCADFSQTDISTGNAVFGDSPLQFDTTAACRPTFQSTTMSCEFFDQWNALDLSSAIVSACQTQMKGHDFSSAMMAHVHFDGIDLTGTTWDGAVLTGASFQGATLDNATGLAGTTAQPSELSGAYFNNASLKGVDLSNALLYGANFTYANLENASLSGSFLTNNEAATPPIRNAAVFTGAHLKNVNLSGAQLDGVSFYHASFYGSFNGLAPPFPCPTDTSQCGTTPVTGFTCSCATARGATMVDTNFSPAYLYGVDFGGSTTHINGGSFNGAILVGANFTGATFGVDQNGKPPDFSNAYLQGVQFGTEANLTDTSLSGAFVDFGAANNPITGNFMQLLLGPAYTAFNGWEAPNQSVCVQAAYGSPGCNATNTCYTVVPTSIPTMTCPDGYTYPEGCGPAYVKDVPNPHWRSPSGIDQAPPYGWYQFDATYTKADQSNACNANTFNLDW